MTKKDADRFYILQNFFKHNKDNIIRELKKNGTTRGFVFNDPVRQLKHRLGIEKCSFLGCRYCS